MSKQTIDTIHEKNNIIHNIIDAMTNRKCFLILGHVNPDEDCIASMVAAALILNKFYKDVQLFIEENIHEHFQYLINICEYNSIQVISKDEEIEKNIDTIIICDTPKLSMVHTNKTIDTLMEDSKCIKIEVDHHIGADSAYIGDEGFSLVTEASSASELVGLIALKMRKKDDLMLKYNITNFLTRNLVLSILTGIIGDSKMGKFLKSKRERKYYKIFSNLYNKLLESETIKETNFTNMSEVFNEIQRLSDDEESCFNFIVKKKDFSKSIGFLILNQEDMEHLKNEFDQDIIINAIRSVADHLAEESKRLSLVAFDDKNSDLIQFRIRRSHIFKTFDVRKVLDIFTIKNGGGHEGAIGFRMKRDDIDNIPEYVKTLTTGIDKHLN